MQCEDELMTQGKQEDEDGSYSGPRRRKGNCKQDIVKEYDNGKWSKGRKMLRYLEEL